MTTPNKVKKNKNKRIYKNGIEADKR